MKNKIVSILAVLLISVVSFPQLASAHCDTMDGPVVVAARKALETNNVNYVLIWVKKEKEPELKAIFQKTLAERTSRPGEKEAIDMTFFESLVRIHREGEGVSFTGLKPAGTVVEPIVIAVDSAIEHNSVESLSKMLNEEILKNIQERFKKIQEKKNYNVNNSDDGREYIESYVTFVHYVEGIDSAINAQTVEHGAESLAGSHTEEDVVVSLKKQLYFSWGVSVLLAIVLVLKSLRRRNQ